VETETTWCLPTGFGVPTYGVLGTPVLDHTELTGKYDFDQRQIDPLPEQRMDFVAAYLSLVEEMNLRIFKSKQLTQRFVVDSAQKPSPN
jgi:uncharacterized protein (TIGR03435 family)